MQIPSPFSLAQGRTAPSLFSGSLSRQLPLGKDSEEKIGAEAEEVCLSEPLIWSSASMQSSFGLSHLHFWDLPGISWLECVHFSSFFLGFKICLCLIISFIQGEPGPRGSVHKTVVWLAERNFLTFVQGSYSPLRAQRLLLSKPSFFLGYGKERIRGCLPQALWYRRLHGWDTSGKRFWWKEVKLFSPLNFIIRHFL